MVVGVGVGVGGVGSRGAIAIFLILSPPQFNRNIITGWICLESFMNHLLPSHSALSPGLVVGGGVYQKISNF